MHVGNISDINIQYPGRMHDANEAINYEDQRQPVDPFHAFIEKSNTKQDERERHTGRTDHV